jgi:uncharacterized membrane-anchored protein
MQDIHLPTLRARYWVALCIASIFGANMGDFFARDVGLGHIAGLPILVAALVAVMVIERFDRTVHQAWYWLAIIIVRTAATNTADFACGDLKQPRIVVIGILAVLLVIAVAASWQLAWRHVGKIDRGFAVVRADAGYWISMFIAGTLGTVIGDYTGHDFHLGDAMATIALGVPLAALFWIGRNGLLRWLPFYWVTVVAVRAAGTSAGDFLAGRNMLGLPLSTLVTGASLVALLLLWREQRKLLPSAQAN